MNSRTAAGVVMALVACSQPPQGTHYIPPGPFVGARLAAADLWSGNDVTVISSSFRGLAVLPVVQLSGVAAIVRRLDDSTIAAILPDTDGVLAVRVSADSFSTFDSSIAVHGFQQMRTGPDMPGSVQPLPGQPVVIGAGAVGLIEVNLRTAAIQKQFPDSVHSIDCMSGVGQSVVPGHFVLYGKTPAGGGREACTAAASWAYGSAPVRTGLLFNDFPTSWAEVEIGSGGSVYGSGNGDFGGSSFFVDRCGAGVCPRSQYRCTNCASFMTGLTVGAIAQRAVTHSSKHLVLNTQTGDSSYSIPFPLGNSHIDGAVFSPGEDTMYVIGGNNLIMLNSATGAIYRSGSVPDSSGAGWGIARDDQHPWIYVFTIWFSGKPPLLTVIDRRTLATIATVRAPPSVVLQQHDLWDSFRLVRDPEVNRLYVVATRQDHPPHNQPSRILSYGVPYP